MTDNKKTLNQKVALWVEGNLKILGFILGASLVAGISVWGWVQWKGYKEKQANEILYMSRKALEEVAESVNGKNYRGKESLSSLLKKNKKKNPLKYSDEMKKQARLYRDKIEEFQNTKSAASATIDLSHFYLHFGQKKEARELLSLFVNEKGTLYDLLRLQLASQYMNENECKEALILLNQITKNKKSKSFYWEAFLQKAICYEQTGDVLQAEKAYKTIIDNNPETVRAHTAESYLRLFRLKQKMKKK